MKKGTRKSKAELSTQKQYALDSTLWAGDNVIVANAIQLGVQNLQINAKRVVYLGLSKIEFARPGSACMTENGWEVELTASDFGETFNLHENNVYEWMKLGVSQLMKKMVAFSYIDSTTKLLVEVELPWVGAASYINQTGTIRLAFNNHLTPYITRMAAKTGGYTIQKIKQSGGIRTIRGWRLFDMLTTQRDTGTLKISVSDLMRALEVKKKEDEEKVDYYEFKRKILMPAINDIMENAKVIIEFDEKKNGRRIVSLDFKFRDLIDTPADSSEHAGAAVQSEQRLIQEDYAIQLAESREDTARIAKMLEAQKQLAARNNIDYDSANDSIHQPRGFEDFPFDDENDTPEQRLEKMRQHFNQPVIGGRA
jgi:plasmid replication initiation protein